MNHPEHHLVEHAAIRAAGAMRRWPAALACLMLAILVCLPVARAADPPAGVAPRGSLLPLAQPLWSDLSPFQRETLAPLEAQWNGMPLAKKRSWLSLTAKMPAMNPAERAIAQKRIREWASLSPEQRRMARDNYRLAKSLDRDERLATWESYRQMTPEQRSVLRVDGWTSNTAARHAGASTGLAKEAARPIAAAPPSSPAKPAGRPPTRVARPSAFDPLRSAD